jgi:hypothetical protein
VPHCAWKCRTTQPEIPAELAILSYAGIALAPAQISAYQIIIDDHHHQRHQSFPLPSQDPWHLVCTGTSLRIPIKKKL